MVVLLHHFPESLISRAKYSERHDRKAEKEKSKDDEANKNFRRNQTFLQLAEDRGLSDLVDEKP
jgi:hypothetical protein